MPYDPCPKCKHPQPEVRRSAETFCPQHPANMLTWVATQRCPRCGHAGAPHSRSKTIYTRTPSGEPVRCIDCSQALSARQAASVDLDNPRVDLDTEDAEERAAIQNEGA